MLLKLVVLILLGLLGTTSAWAIDTYVSMTGNDANACGAGIGSPKRTIQNGVDSPGCAGAGNRLIVRDGTYTQTTNVTSGGTNGNPFIIVAENPCTFNPVSCSAVIDGPVGDTAGFHVTACNITIEGFEIKQFSGPPSGQAAGIFLESCGSNTATMTIKGNHIHDQSGVDNPSAVKVNGSDYFGIVDIYNNLIHDNGTGSASVPQNWVGIVIFSDFLSGSEVSDVRIHNNECYNQENCYRYKHGAGGGIPSFLVEKNICHDLNDVAQGSACVLTEQDGSIIRYNICYNHPTAGGGGCFIPDEDGASGDSDNSQIYNNCTYNVGVAVRTYTTKSTGTIIHDNIFSISSGGEAAIALAGSMASQLASLNFDSYDTGVATTVSVKDSGGNHTFSNVQSGGREASGRSGSPGYVNAAGGDFHLTAGSANQGIGTGGNDIGCYPTETEVIGIDSGGADTTPPATPTGLTVSKVFQESLWPLQ